jgi:protocatechuate 3,4-dioxygenase beta subunit
VTGSTPGVRLTVSGYVLGRACKPVPGVLLDFWQADTNGAYDMSGFAFRGHQFTDQSGSFSLTTIVPGCTRAVRGTSMSRPGRPARAS